MTDTAAIPGHVCMAVFEPKPELLRIQIASLQRQTHEDWKCIVGVDGSDSRAEKLLDELTRDDPRFSVVTFEERVGFYRNFERILELVPTKVPWVALSDQDDYWKPDKLSLLIPFLEDNSLVQGQARVRHHGVDESRSEGDVITARRSLGLAAILIDNQVTGSLALFRGDLLQNALPFPAATDLAFHDHWLAICAVLEDGIYVYPHVVQDYVQHGANVIGENLDDHLPGRFRRLRDAAGGSLSEQLDYLGQHRWGWRVNMASAALRGNRQLSQTHKRTLELYSQNDFSFRLFRVHVIECLSGRAPVPRTVALLFGSMRASRMHQST